MMDLPIKNGGSFHSYVSLPEGSWCLIVKFVYNSANDLIFLVDISRGMIRNLHVFPDEHYGKWLLAKEWIVTTHSTFFLAFNS